ncbi:septum site-determining protein MinC [Orrella daihaiensis]|uniref:Probable septum site-determining protein MinC n=1 Tax=Orrella daihaiensis TaxID=2782176 RepID=A0ABY4ATE7_9BURK|nr:septum site-determining protein MinC [Orrella daihaiensis]UOD51319.1 septum site-determining protein MinC [Orrella daihaiensis]
MNTNTAALEFKSATLYALRAVLHSDHTETIIESLNQRMADAGSFFAGESVVIDASSLQTSPNWDDLLEAFSNHGLPVIGIVAAGDVAQSALEHGLANVELSNATQKTVSAPQAAVEVAEPVEKPTPVPKANTAAAEPAKDAAPVAAPPAPAGSPTMVIEGPLRSGQRVYARDADLVVMGVVSQGAEVIADGNIHVYGPLRGKAMAGARGDSQARIFTTSLDAELVAVAGVYRVIDSALPSILGKKPAMVFLKDQALRLEPLGD